MAHELDKNTATGRAAMFSVRETPWHQLGTVVQDAPSFAAAVQLAGVDFEVALRKVQVQLADGTWAGTDKGWAVVRTDRDAVLGLVGTRYEPIQNRDGFGILEPLVDRGVLQLETGGSLRGGADTWMLARWNFDDPVVREVMADEVRTYTLLTLNHSGFRRMLGMETPVRVVCANTLSAAINGWAKRASVVSVPHRKGARVRVVEAAEVLFAQVLDRYRTIAEHYRTMKQTILTVEAFTSSVLDVAAPMPAVPEVGAKPEAVKLYERQVDRQLDRRNALTTAWDAGTGHVGDRSAWEAYNGAVEVLDHNDQLYRSRNRLTSLMDGQLGQTKAQVLQAVLAECKR